MKRLMGKTEVEDALARLDTLTQEENLMTAVARNLEATHNVNVNVKATQELTQHVDEVVMEIQDVAKDVALIQEVDKDGALIFQFLHTRTDHLCLNSNGWRTTSVTPHYYE